MQIASSPTAGATHFGEWKSFCPTVIVILKSCHFSWNRIRKVENLHVPTGYLVFAGMSNYWGDAYSPREMGR